MPLAPKEFNRARRIKTQVNNVSLSIHYAREFVESQRRLKGMEQGKEGVNQKTLNEIKVVPWENKNFKK